LKHRIQRNRASLVLGGHYGPYIHPVFTTETEANLAQCFVAIDPCFFAPGFQERLTDLTTILRNLEPVLHSFDLIFVSIYKR
jgi:LDH2 family malate/lactate/ureidoglycolate dehydrogenase